ncbi:hypothetical protein U8607_05505 [Methylobacterium durans]|uniref:hypothetical protein n=1 Tax=Methylobacterium durans TaxID=2202825 RepID=UPI002AFEDCCF|nr:hypothetical protein [Methylobacterium durans]MEA1831536.1 hypothetical protein [Methylobacterium durans]
MAEQRALRAPIDHEVLLGEIQHLLGALADVETDFAVACEERGWRPSGEGAPSPDRATLEAERQRRREPLIRRLDSLDRACRALQAGNAA